ncbi:liver carboxylesterase-like [Leptonychotes weddellii]|uniref:Liver carboxylesterase-like n=1 Tax=Leptonychotes weddellii TaxID=9713 RepID=A0A7F8Q9N3_LEPWE|nr:liver carboxylesterase-like [Leptonychotes weddellii]
MWLFALVLTSLATSMTWGGHPSSPPVVDTVKGKVLGKYVSLEGSAQPVAVFLGVPFARPPLGPLRFAPPQPTEPWNFVKNTTSYPPMRICYVAMIDETSGIGHHSTPSPTLLPRVDVLPSGVTCTWPPLFGSLNSVATARGHAGLGCWLPAQAGGEGAVRVGSRREAWTPRRPPPQNHPFLPTVVDGVLLPKMPEEILAEKKFNSVPYIIGINKQEFGWLLPMMMGYPLSEGKLDQKTAASLLWKSYPIAGIPEDLTSLATEKFLGGTDDPVKNKDLFLDMLGDLVFGVPSVTVARHHRDAGAPTYMYEFQYRPSFSSDLKPKMVVGDHGDELFSVFGAPLLKGGASEEEVRLSKMVMKLWANFARNGNPNGDGLPSWPPYDQKEGYLQIGVTTQPAQKLKDKEVVFWTELLAKGAAEKPPHTKHVEL